MTDYSPTIFRLVEYEIWCNLRMMDFLSSVSEEDYRRDFGFGWRTPHRTMSHVADVMKAWGGSVGPTIQAPVWPAYDEAEFLQSIRKRLADAGDAWLRSAKASHEQGLLGDERRLHQVFHLVTHGTHHRGQLLSMITLMGHEQPFEGGDFGGWSKQQVRQPRR